MNHWRLEASPALLFAGDARVGGSFYFVNWPRIAPLGKFLE
ncbi:MAG: hypothetical protein QOF70_1762 [Acetobacteraceae bacterium]|jgi:hypothetical protein|nr:hypothetical protein [Acetobacteraceae bacterium]